MSSSQNTTADADPRLACEICQKQFSRLEHLRRHNQLHVRDTSYRCRYCDRTFTRKDSAKRHEHAHEAPALPISSAQASIRRSCSACAASRIKCSGGEPCEHCAGKKLSCTYIPRKRRRSQFERADASATTISRNPNIVDTEGNTQKLPHGPIIAILPTNAIDGLSFSQDYQTDDEINTELQAGGGGLPADNSDGNLISTAPQSSEASAEEAAIPIETRPTADTSSSRLTHLCFGTRDTNWLPFDQSSTSPLGPANLEHTTTAPTSIESADIAHREEIYHGSRDEHDPVLQNDRVTALITSMRTGLPGFSQDLVEHGSSKNSTDQRQSSSLYSDGAGARMSQADRRILERQKSHNITGEHADDNHGFLPPWIGVLQAKLRKGKDRGATNVVIPESVYQEAFEKLSRPWTDSMLTLQFSGFEDIILQKDTLELFVQLYFDNFHPVYPFLDRSLLSIPVWGWSLFLATAAIGTRYLCVSELTAYGDVLCNILYELLFKEIVFGQIEDSLPYLQARVLAAIGLCHTNQGFLMNRGFDAAALVFNSCLRLRLLEEDDRIGAFQHDQDLEQVWIAWRFRETRRRTGLFIWMIDSILAYMTQIQPRFRLKLLNLKLPSADDLWEADSCQKWYEILGKEDLPHDPEAFKVEEKSRDSVQDAARKVRVQLSPPKSATEFAVSALIHMLIRRIWEAASWLEIENNQTRSRFYLASSLEFSKWRNHTCDCLDTLHWDALGVSARAGGLEGPVFLHLHLARLILLTPIRELFGHIQNIRKSLPNLLLPHEIFDASEPDSQCRQTILTWANQDRHKARLALIHAGSIFWHVRRYSSDSFMQAFAVFAASVVLWAYGKFFKTTLLPTTHISPGAFATESSVDNHPSSSVVSDAQNMISPAASANSQSSPQANTSLPVATPNKRRRMPNFMQLDRPMDDELVQHFIRAGEGMTLYLEGVDDLCSRKGNLQVLAEAILILKESKDIWPISENYAESLEELMRAE